MPNIQSDLVSRVTRFPKPRKTAEALQPIFEAVSNSLDAVSNKFGSETADKGTISVSISGLENPSTLTVRVCDNGIGLDKAHFEAFCTTDTGFKMGDGGKGVGRLLWLDAFHKITITSVFQDGGKTLRRSFVFKLDNSDPISDEKIEEVVDSDLECGTHLLFEGLKGKSYQTQFPSKKASLLSHFGSHFFADFMTGDQPKIVVDVDGESTCFPEEIRMLKIEERDTLSIETEKYGTLKLKNFVCLPKASANFDGNHHLHLVANGRTVVTQKIDGLIGVGRFGTDEDYVFQGCVTGDFLDENVSQERTKFNFEDNNVKEIVKACAEKICDEILTAEMAAFDEARLSTLNDFLKKYPSFAFQDPEYFLKTFPKNTTKPEEFAQHLIWKRIRRDEDREKNFNKIVQTLKGNSATLNDFKETVRIAAQDIKQEEQRHLTEYVLRRKMVLDLMELAIGKLRHIDTGKQDHHLESTLHQFLCPMGIAGDDPNKTSQSDHDLWLIDERLTFAKHFASDKSLSKVLKETETSDRPDLLIYDKIHGLTVDEDGPLSRILLVEFKRPGRKEYQEQYSPINQISKYLNHLKSGEIYSHKGVHIRIAKDCVFHCFVIADIVGDLKIHTSTWRTTADGRGRILDLNGDFQGTIEIIEWADLLRDARLRNQAFIQAAGCA